MYLYIYIIYRHTRVRRTEADAVSSASQHFKGPRQKQSDPGGTQRHPNPNTKFSRSSPLWPLEALDCWAGLLLRLPRRNANRDPQGLNMTWENCGRQDADKMLRPIQPIHWHTSSYVTHVKLRPCCTVIPANDCTSTTTKQPGHARATDNAIIPNTSKCCILD